MINLFIGKNNSEFKIFYPKKDTQKLYLPHYKFSANLFKTPFNGKLFVNYSINKALALTVYRNRKMRYKFNKLILIVRQNRHYYLINYIKSCTTLTE